MPKWKDGKLFLGSIAQDPASDRRNGNRQDAVKAQHHHDLGGLPSQTTQEEPADQSSRKEPAGVHPDAGTQQAANQESLLQAHLVFQTSLQTAHSVPAVRRQAFNFILLLIRSLSSKQLDPLGVKNSRPGTVESKLH